MAGEGMKFFLEIENVLTEMLTCKQAAYHYNFSIRTIQQWIDEGKISGIQIEGRFWVSKSEIETFVKARAYKHRVMAE